MDTAPQARTAARSTDPVPAVAAAGSDAGRMTPRRPRATTRTADAAPTAAGQAAADPTAAGRAAEAA